MPKEYIDREALLHKIRWASSAEEAVMSVRRMPAADVVEVVRCKDCKHWLDAEGIEERDGVRFARCDVHNFRHIDGNHYGWCPTEYDFCSWGEMKEGANDA